MTVCICHEGSVCTEGCERGLHHDGCAQNEVDRVAADNVKLEPCPFCGKAPEAISVNDVYGFRIRCGTLGCAMDMTMVKPRQWNTRASSDAPRAALQEITTHKHEKYGWCATLNGFANGGGDWLCGQAIARAALSTSQPAKPEEKQ